MEKMSKRSILYILKQSDLPKKSRVFRRIQASNVQANRSLHGTPLNNLVSQLVKEATSKRFNKSAHYFDQIHILNNVRTETGAYAEMPKWYKLGYLKVITNIIVFIIIGSYISKTTVTFLEENDIFKPEDDDDDDD
jgi:hypothetical protein